jgi:hypothetical protein
MYIPVMVPHTHVMASHMFLLRYHIRFYYGTTHAVTIPHMLLSRYSASTMVLRTCHGTTYAPVMASRTFLLWHHIWSFHGTTYAVTIPHMLLSWYHSFIMVPHMHPSRHHICFCHRTTYAPVMVSRFYHGTTYSPVTAPHMFLSPYHICSCHGITVLLWHHICTCHHTTYAPVMVSRVYHGTINAPVTVPHVSVTICQHTFKIPKTAYNSYLSSAVFKMSSSVQCPVHAASKSLFTPRVNNTCCDVSLISVHS